MWKDASPQFRVPVALFIYKRPDLTHRTLVAIRQVRPATLMVIADGPRNSTEEKPCLQARALLEMIDWHCHLETNFSDSNLGCRTRLASGLNWVFSRCEAAVILEDDCIPHITFFRFSEEMLNRYRSDERIMMIGGSNPLDNISQSWPYSYFFSRYALIWGWATWRRAWRFYDPEMVAWPDLRESREFVGWHDTEEECAHWRRRFDRTYAGHSTWDHQWTLTCWRKRGLSVLPTVNLVSNVGFGPGATHCIDARDSEKLCRPLNEMYFPLQHPLEIALNKSADYHIFNRIFKSDE